jgi:hypothetical protein
MQTIIFKPIKKNVFDEIAKNSVKEYNTRASGSKFEWATLIGAPSRNLKYYNRKLADSTVGVAPNM